MNLLDKMPRRDKSGKKPGATTKKGSRTSWAAVANVWGQLRRYPSAVFGIAVILILVAVAVFALVTIPYKEAVRLWRGGEAVWYQNPKFAAPVWFNWFTRTKLPISFRVNTVDGTMAKTVTAGSKDVSNEDFSYTFDYEYDEPPQELLLYFTSQFQTKRPFVSVTLTTPDGRVIRALDTAIDRRTVFRFSSDEKFLKRLHTTLDQSMRVLFANPESDSLSIQKGNYQVHVVGTTFEPNSNIDVEFVLHGQLAGWAGTDQYRRDIGVALLWGTPVALAFGLLAAVGTSFLTMIFAAVGVWYGGWVDGLIQRITEINLILPFLAILILIGTLYSKSIWTILGATVLLSIFSGNIKAYRAVFLQSRASPYIEAAQAYGASNGRIIFGYLIPRMIPILIPGLVFSIPSFVFLEASLAVLGLGDPVLPTWGKLVEDAYINGALYRGFYYWVLEPAVLLMLTGFGFAMLGFSLDRIFNPRLRNI